MNHAREYSKIKAIAAIVLLALISADLSAQDADYFLGYKKYAFIQYNKNILLYGDSCPSFMRLMPLLDSMIIRGKGKLTVVHMGGSHIQADIYTHVIRKRFQQLAAGLNGGRGLIFPCEMAKTNNPDNFSERYTGDWEFGKSTSNPYHFPLGLTGFAVETTDSVTHLSIDPNRDSSIHYTFDKIRIFHEPSSFKILAETRSGTFQGKYIDSLGCTVINFPNDQDSLDLTFIKEIPGDNFILQGISLDSDAPGVVYDAIGVNGASLPSYLGCIRYKKHLAAIKPDLVIFSIGTNDAYTRHFYPERYRAEFRKLIDSTKAAVPDACIIITVPNDSYLFRRYVNQNTAVMRNVILELAREYNCPVWDFYTIMGGLNSSATWYSLNLMRDDRVHFTREGYDITGDLFFSAFLKSWEKTITDNNIYTRRP